MALYGFPQNINVVFYSLFFGYGFCLPFLRLYTYGTWLYNVSFKEAFNTICLRPIGGLYCKKPRVNKRQKLA
jgi:hypothetical protein